MKGALDLDLALMNFLKDYDEEIWCEFILMKNWKKIGGRRLPTSIKLRNGVLRIVSYDSTLRFFVECNKSRIIKSANDVIGKEVVKDVVVQGVEIPIFKKFNSKGNRKR